MPSGVLKKDMHKEKYQKLHVLVDNAGGAFWKRQVNPKDLKKPLHSTT